MRPPTRKKFVSAGVLLWREGKGGVEFLLVHPGGPFFASKDEGVWSIPKGLLEEGEDPEKAALREFAEETGRRATGKPVPLGSFPQRSGKVVLAFALRGDLDPAEIRSNTFSLEWPPGSGRVREFPETDRAAWFSPDEARRKINPGQIPVIEAFLRADIA